MGWTISWEEFLSYVNGFVAVSDEISDGWHWQGEKDHPGGAFVWKRAKRQTPEEAFTGKQDETELFEDSSLQTEDRITAGKTKEQVRETVWDYHILYSPSYASPVLYFNAFTSDGRLLPLEILWRGLQKGTQEALQQMRWEALSQQEHPVLRRPFFQLHPCKTAEFLNVHKGYSKNPIVTWLSSMGPSVGLDIKNEYSHLVKLDDGCTEDKDKTVCTRV